MARHVHRIPSNPPDQPVVKKSYCAVVRSDGTLLPIEERLGRRLLRSLAPGSREARGLLRRGCVTLTTSDGQKMTGLTIEEVYERLCSETNARLALHADDAEWSRTCREALTTIHRWRRALSQNH